MAFSVSTPWGGVSHQHDHQKSFEQAGSISDPRQSLQQLLMALDRLGQGITERGPSRLRSSFVQKGPEPVSVPGLPFQIGGGLGTDPALMDPSLLVGSGREGPGAFKYDPFGGAPSSPMGPAMSLNAPSQVNRRKPSNG